MDVDLRASSEGDAEEMAALHAAEAALPPWSAAAYREELRAAGSVCVSAREAGRLSGFVLVRLVPGGEAELRMLLVAPGARRAGLGRRLLEEAEARAARAGARRMRLEVSSANPAGLRLYEGSRYAVVGRRGKYYNDGSDALLMDKEVS